MGWDDWAVVGRVARPHGLKGQVVVKPETDFVEQRFAKGATVWTRSNAGEERLTVSSLRLQNGRPIVGFVGFDRIEDVERLAGLELRVPEAALQGQRTVEGPGGAFRRGLHGAPRRLARAL